MVTAGHVLESYTTEKWICCLPFRYGSFATLLDTAVTTLTKDKQELLSTGYPYNDI